MCILNFVCSPSDDSSSDEYYSGSDRFDEVCHPDEVYKLGNEQYSRLVCMSLDTVFYHRCLGSAEEETPSASKFTGHLGYQCRDYNKSVGFKVTYREEEIFPLGADVNKLEKTVLIL